MFTMRITTRVPDAIFVTEDRAFRVVAPLDRQRPLAQAVPSFNRGERSNVDQSAHQEARRQAAEG